MKPTRPRRAKLSRERRLTPRSSAEASGIGSLGQQGFRAGVVGERDEARRLGAIDIRFGCDRLGKDDGVGAIGLLGLLVAETLRDERAAERKHGRTGPDRQHALTGLAFVGVRHPSPPRDDRCSRGLYMVEDRTESFREV